MTVISGIGGYVPTYRIERTALDPAERGDAETAVPDCDETHITMAAEAAERALASAGMDGSSLEAVLVASVSDPFAIHGIAAQLAYHVGTEGDVRTGDFRSTGRASTEAMSAGRDMCAAGADTVLVTGVDIAPAYLSGDEVETAGAGAGAMVLSADGAADAVATIEGVGRQTTGFVERHRQHGSPAVPGDVRFERRQGLLPAVMAAADQVRSGQEPADRAVVGTVDRRAARRIADERANTLVSTHNDIGHAGTASFYIDLALAAEEMSVGESVLAVGYGPGGADAMDLRVDGESESGIQAALDEKEYVTYREHLTNRPECAVEGRS